MTIPRPRLVLGFTLLLSPIGCGLLLGLDDKDLAPDPSTDAAVTDAVVAPPAPDALANADAASLDGGDAAPAVVWPVYSVESFAEGQQGPWGVAVDDAHVYWSNEVEGTIRRRAKTSDAGVVEVARDLPHPEDISAGPNAISWIATNAPVVTAESPDGGDAGPLALPVAGRVDRFIDGGSGLTVLDRDVNERKYRRLTRGRFNADGGAQIREGGYFLQQIGVVFDDRDSIAQVAVNGDWDSIAHSVGATHVWVAMKGAGLMRAPLDGKSAPVSVADDSVVDVTTDGQNPFWLTRGGVVRTLAADGSTVTLSRGDPAPYGRIALDSKYVLWLRSEQDSPTEGSVLIARRDGTTPLPGMIADRQNGPRSIALERDSRNVLVAYFTTYGDGRVKRVRITPEP